MKKAVIFDLDGTLMHTLPDIHAAIVLMQKELGYPESTYEDTVGGINRGARFLVAHALPEGETDENVDRALAVYTEKYKDHYADTSSPYEGVGEMAAKLKAQGVKMAVLSNKPDPFTKRLVREHFGDTFPIVVGQGEYAPKPSPEAPLAIANAMGVSCEDVTLVGDSDIDVATAKAAGMGVIGVGWGYRDEETLRQKGADVIVGTADELYEALTSN